MEGSILDLDALQSRVESRLTNTQAALKARKKGRPRKPDARDMFSSQNLNLNFFTEDNSTACKEKLY